MMSARHFRRHGRFYGAALAGLGSWPLAVGEPLAFRILLSGDVFYVAYLALMLIFAVGIDATDLRRRAAEEDEGVLLIVGLTAVAVVFSLGAVFLMLNGTNGPTALIAALAAASVPLSWATIHTLAAFHYAHLYYAPGKGGDAGGLDFPETPVPGMVDFAYYSFVVGMTAQVSDVQVTTTRMRWPTLIHGCLSFFYNTVLIALSVNAVVTLAN